MATHYVARELSALGHDVKQVPPAYAKPFRQGHKNLNIREVLTVYPRCALVGAALGERVGQNALTTERVEAIAGFCLRFRVQRLLQFLNSFRS